MPNNAPLTLADQATSEITEMILDGRLPLGSAVNETELAKRLTMSRGPVREAVRRLQGRNLVTSTPYQKSRVIDLSAEEIRQIFELRAALEGAACELATRHIQQDVLNELALALEINAPSDLPGPDIHAPIAAACGNERITAQLRDELHYLLRIYRRRSGDRPGRRPAAREEHWQIVRAMQARDELLAGSLMRAHIRNAVEWIS